MIIKYCPANMNTNKKCNCECVPIQCCEIKKLAVAILNNQDPKQILKDMGLE